MTAAPRALAPLDLLQLLSIALIWGVNNIFAKIAIDALPAMMTAALRFVIVLACLAAWLRPPPKENRWLFFAMLACVGPLHFGIQYAGLKLAHDLAPMVVVMQLWAPASVVFAAVLLKEIVSPLRWAGVAVAFLGAASLNFDPVVFAQGWALLFVATASCCYGLGTVLVRRLGGGLDPWATQAWIALASAPTLSLASLAFEHDHLEQAQHAHWSIWFFVVFGAVVSSIVANAFIFRLVQKYEVSRTTPYLLMTPVITFTLAAFVLGDTITPNIIAGAATTMLGVGLVALAERRFKPVAPSPD
ncbi:DMT family transporter [Terricaulis sp.]|uniref:DMT family transporter n=1 Tax=Terricaulis sp. TaxID=2768686 RepID=UPI0037834EB5